jgi:GT2 family glycosyltransferase
MSATISVIIVTYNGRTLLEPCLRALFAGSRLPNEVIVVDNASSDDTVPWLTKTYPLVRIDHCVVNLGFAAANNRAIRASSGTYLLTLNNDTEIAPMRSHIWRLCSMTRNRRLRRSCQRWSLRHHRM